MEELNLSEDHLVTIQAAHLKQSAFIRRFGSAKKINVELIDDHTMSLSAESMERCRVDYTLLGSYQIMPIADGKPETQESASVIDVQPTSWICWCWAWSIIDDSQTQMLKKFAARLPSELQNLSRDVVVLSDSNLVTYLESFLMDQMNFSALHKIPMEHGAMIFGLKNIIWRDIVKSPASIPNSDGITRVVDSVSAILQRQKKQDDPEH